MVPDQPGETPAEPLTVLRDEARNAGREHYCGDQYVPVQNASCDAHQRWCPSATAPDAILRTIPGSTLRALISIDAPDRIDNQ